MTVFIKCVEIFASTRFKAETLYGIVHTAVGIPSCKVIEAFDTRFVVGQILLHTHVLILPYQCFLHFRLIVFTAKFFCRFLQCVCIGTRLPFRLRSLELRLDRSLIAAYGEALDVLYGVLNFVIKNRIEVF